MRLGILGGTFDPPHIGHLIVAQDAWAALQLDRVLFVPAGRPPHKQALTPAELRLLLALEIVQMAPQVAVRTDGATATLTADRPAFFVMAAAPAGARVHQVQPNDSLWKIAERYAGDRGVLEMIEAILKANPDKLKDEKSLLRVGWSLVIPE